MAASTASAPLVEKSDISSGGPAARGERHGELCGVRCRTRVAEIQRPLVEERMQACEQPRMVVPDVDAAEPGEQVEIPAAPVIPHERAFRARKDTAVAEAPSSLTNAGSTCRA